MTTPFKEITSGLKFPEGPIAMPDGSFLVGNMADRSIARISAAVPMNKSAFDWGRMAAHDLERRAHLVRVVPALR